MCRLRPLTRPFPLLSSPLPGKTQAERAKAELERYLHYYQRFHGHDSSLKFAANQRAITERRMGEMQEAQKSPMLDVECLRAANEQIIECRRVLKYTYVLGFFLEDGTPEKQLFEHQQEMLEKNTESLHRCVPFCSFSFHTIT
jgi:ariadne-1